MENSKKILEALIASSKGLKVIELEEECIEKKKMELQLVQLAFQCFKKEKKFINGIFKKYKNKVIKAFREAVKK